MKIDFIKYPRANSRDIIFAASECGQNSFYIYMYENIANSDLLSDIESEALKVTWST